jgi:AraC-like DNA-binding protein
MPDALATLFEDACPRARHMETDSDDWQVSLSEEPALHVVVALDGGGWVTGMSGRRRPVTPGDVIVATGAVELYGDAAQPRPHHILVGTYDVGGSVCDRALTGLPDVIVADTNAQTAALTAMLTDETEAMRAGRDAVVIRVLDLLAVTAIRQWMEANPDVSPAWVSAHKDPVVSRALQLIHDNPGGAWTLESLAQQSGSSRSALSRRFSLAMGESPMGYLTCWRLCLASDLLQKTDAPLSAVATRVGYANPYAFSAAFHRYYGVRPGAHRRRYRSVSRASNAIRSPL